MFLFVVFAPSGTGKTSLVQALVSQTTGLRLSVSHTTRAKRDGEVDGRDYIFVSEQEFAALRQESAFIESACVYGNWYGTSKALVSKQLADSDLLLEIDWQGAQQIRRALPQSVLIGIQPPTVAEVRARLERRAKDSPETIDARMQSIVDEIRQLQMADYLVINDKFDQALSDLQSIVRSCRLQYKAMRQQHQKLIQFAT